MESHQTVKSTQRSSTNISDQRRKPKNSRNRKSSNVIEKVLHDNSLMTVPHNDLVTLLITNTI